MELQTFIFIGRSGCGKGTQVHEEEIGRRLNWFESDVLPAVEYFRKYSKYAFVELNGDQPVEAVQQELLAKVFG